MASRFPSFRWLCLGRSIDGVRIASTSSGRGWTAAGLSASSMGCRSTRTRRCAAAGHRCASLPTNSTERLSSPFTACRSCGSRAKTWRTRVASSSSSISMEFLGTMKRLVSFGACRALARLRRTSLRPVVRLARRAILRLIGEAVARNGRNRRSNRPFRATRPRSRRVYAPRPVATAASATRTPTMDSPPSRPDDTTRPVSPWAFSFSAAASGESPLRRSLHTAS